MADSDAPLVSVMLAVPDAPRAAEWYRQALGAEELWNLGSVIGLTMGGAPLFLGEQRTTAGTIRRGSGCLLFASKYSATILTPSSLARWPPLPRAGRIRCGCMRCRGDHIGKAVSSTHSDISGSLETGRRCVDLRARSRRIRQPEIVNDDSGIAPLAFVASVRKRSQPA
jgi:catechol 2,3-dioxygenase-like lactoylglutathione lyase family enzyme